MFVRHAIVLLLVLAATAWAQPGDPAIADLISGYIAASNARDLERHQALYAPEAVMVRDGKPLTAPLRDTLTDLYALWNRYRVVFHPPASVVQEPLDENGRVVLRFTIPATARFLGMSFDRCIDKRLTLMPGPDGYRILRDESPSRESLKDKRDAC